MAIDAVYTWANFFDPKWREPYDHFAALEGRRLRPADPANTGEIRHTDNGELRYSLRSLERYAPFIRRLHLVIDGAPPDWLKVEAPDVRILSSHDIFPEGFPLPVFSSDLIESFLWRAPDLAEHHVYFNDDMVLAGDLTEGDFFDADGRSIVRMKTGLMHAPLDPRDLTYNQILRNTARAIRRRLALRYRPRFETRKPWVPLIVRRLLRGSFPLNMKAHIAQPFHRSLWPLFHETFRNELRALATSRFRHGRGFCVNMAYQYLAYKQQKAVFTFEESDLVILRGPALAEPRTRQEEIRAARRAGLKFLCFNDGAGGSSEDWARFIDEALREMLDKPSRWERTA